MSEAIRDLDPASTLFIVASKTFGTLGDADQRRRAAMCWITAALGEDAKPTANTSSRSPRRGEGRLRLASTPRTCSASGTGSVDETRRTRPSGSSTTIAIGANDFADDARRISRMDEHFRRRRGRRSCLSAHGPAQQCGTATFLGHRYHRGAAGPELHDAIPRVPAAVDHGEQRQVRAARRRARGLPDRRDLLGRAGHERPALVLPNAAPGNAARSPATSSSSRAATTRLADQQDMLVANALAQAAVLVDGPHGRGGRWPANNWPPRTASSKAKVMPRQQAGDDHDGGGAHPLLARAA